MNGVLQELKSVKFSFLMRDRRLGSTGGLGGGLPGQQKTSNVALSCLHIKCPLGTGEPLEGLRGITKDMMVGIARGISTRREWGQFFLVVQQEHGNTLLIHMPSPAGISKMGPLAGGVKQPGPPSPTPSPSTRERKGHEEECVKIQERGMMVSFPVGVVTPTYRVAVQIQSGARQEAWGLAYGKHSELHRRSQLQPEPAKTKALQTVIEMKDTKIASLERNIRDLEDEIQMLKANGVLNTEDREEEIKQIEVYKSHSKFMKTKIDQLKQELSKKESELLALQTKLETLSNQNSDCKQHIEVLKESLTAKEQRAAILQTEKNKGFAVKQMPEKVDALRLRLEEKESFLNKKTKQLQDLTEEKGTLAGEIRDMKDMLEVKERKINVLQKKIENLQEQLRDKDKQLTNLKDRVKSLQTDSSNTDTALATLEEALSEKERIIERLKEQRERDDRERLEEIESFRKENKDLKEKVNALQAELTEKESSLIDLKEHASSLASAGLKRDSKLKSLEIAIEQKKEECSKLEAQLKKVSKYFMMKNGYRQKRNCSLHIASHILKTIPSNIRV
ncbi:hypothetical protein PANDA_001371 [Ailuropoda melanoleuca]|uniref:ELKS/RAB6-interacting/CAST family member 2 n=1 Tax=Ailuropoda melanoleuca TaxID=9646 RepID=D2GWZ3_AILME|nr:hypothetical protein PANDA_001371 [Ailuropoda melanoleuca]